MLDKFNNSLEMKLNLKYGFSHGLYWMLYCCTLSLASAFLLGRGFTTAGVGCLLGFIFIISIFLQQLVSFYADNSKRFTVLDILLGFSAFLFIALIGLCLSKSSQFFSGFWFLIIGMLLTVMLPLLNALNFALLKTGEKINFGICRSAGSLFFFVISLIVGSLMNNVSTNAAPVLALIVSILYIANFVWLRFDLEGFDISQSVEYDPFEDKADSSIFSIEGFQKLFGKYKMFFVFLAGVIGFYFGHVLINNFFYQIVVNVNGNTADTGKVLALQAIVEIPAMVLFEKIRKFISTKKLLGIAAIFFLVKIWFTLIATNVGMLYVSVIFQGISFAIFIPASVHLVDELMTEKDAVKGQAFVTISMTIANFLAALFGGVIINFAGVHVALVIGTIITIIGTSVAIFGLVRIR